MTFGEKLVKARLIKNYSQLELAELVGVSERSIYNYEQTRTQPRKAVLTKIAEVLDVSKRYLMDDYELNPQVNIDHDQFIADAKREYGYKGAREASELLTRASALFAGGELDDSEKDTFFQSLIEVYFESKAEAREKFTPKKRKSRKAGQ